MPDKEIKSNSEKTLVALYCRVSTYEQAQGEFSSLDAQESSLIDFCKFKEWEVYKVYRDTKSGKSLKREKIQELLNDAEDRKFDIVVATKLDRISRDLRDFLEFDTRLTALKIDIVITTQQIDTTSEMGKMQRNLMLVFADFERKMIGERTREKLYLQAQKGYWGGGHTPLGYDSIEKKLIPNVEEAKMVNRIFAMYNEGKSALSIAETLNREGYKPKQRKSKGKIISDKYTNDSILRILKNQIYLGLITITVTKLKGKVLKMPIKETFKGLHQAIIDNNVFNLSKEKLEGARKNKYTDYQGSPLILLQKLVCGTCGAAMSTTFTSKKDLPRVYGYKCIDKGKKGTSFCNAKDIPAAAIENFVISLIQQIGSSEILFDAVFEQFLQNDDSENKLDQEKLKDLQKNLVEVKNESKRLVTLITKNVELEEIDSIKDALTDFNQKQKAIKIEIEKVEEKIANHTEPSNSKEEIKILLTKVPEFLKELDKDGQRKLIDHLINEIKWYCKKGEKEGEIEIFFRGDGALKRKWANNVDPFTLGSRLCLDWLREQDSNLQPFG
jgi:site-specific DNA recombinase